MLVNLVALVLLLLSTTNGKILYKIFRTFENADPSQSGLPWDVWYLHLNWAIDGATVNSGDTFTLLVVCSFIYESTIDLKANGVSIATCKRMDDPSNILIVLGTIQCTILPAIQKNVYYHGSIRLPVLFVSGGTNEVMTLGCRDQFQIGQTKIVGDDGSGNYKLSADMNFIAANNHIRTVNLPASSPNVRLLYIAGGNCDLHNGFASGKIGYSLQDGGVLLSPRHAWAMTDRFNPWLFPTSGFLLSSTCTTNSFSQTLFSGLVGD